MKFKVLYAMLGGRVPHPVLLLYRIASCSVPSRSQVTHWPKKDYGRFYNGDSYIILNTYKKDPSGEVWF